MFQLQFMIEKPRPDLLTLTTTFYDASVSRNLFSKAEMRAPTHMRLLGTDGLILICENFYFSKNNFDHRSDPIHGALKIGVLGQNRTCEAF